MVVPNIRFVFSSRSNSGSNILFVFGFLVAAGPNTNSGLVTFQLANGSHNVNLSATCGL